MSVLSALLSADAKSSADTAARRWRRDLRPPGTGDVRHDMAWRVPPPGGGGTPCPRRGVPVFTGGNKKGQGHRMVPLPPLDSPKPSFAPRLPSVVQRNGGYGGSVPCVGQLLGRCQTLNLLCVICSAVSARPDGAGRQRSAAKSSASIKGVPLEHQTPLWAPRF